MTPQRQQLAAILGMMGSAHDGEIANAARHAERLRKQMGKSWAELLGSAPSPTTAATEPTSCPAVGLYVVANMIARKWDRFLLPYTEGSKGNLTPQQVEQEVNALAKEIIRAYEIDDIGAMNYAASRIWLLTGETFFCVDLDVRHRQYEVSYQAHRSEGIQDAISKTPYLLPIVCLEMMEQEEAEESV